MYNRLKKIRANNSAPQHIIDMAGEYLKVLNSKYRAEYYPLIQSFCDKNRRFTDED